MTDVTCLDTEDFQQYWLAVDSISIIHPVRLRAPAESDLAAWKNSNNCCEFTDDKKPLGSLDNGALRAFIDKKAPKRDFYEIVLKDQTQSKLRYIVVEPYVAENILNAVSIYDCTVPPEEKEY